MPQFASLKEEREYWEKHGPLGEGMEGKIVKAKHKRQSFLTVRLTGEELTKLRDIAATKGIGVSTFARMLILESIKSTK